MNKYILLNTICLSFYFTIVWGQNASDELSCFDCHAVEMEGQTKHEPARESCLDCHQSTGNLHPSDSLKGFTLFEEVPGLCYVCHEEPKTKYIHGPVEDGECSLCHDPHSSQYASLLLVQPLSALCFECHDKDMTLQQVTHQPVVEGNCSVCHDAHGSANRSLIRTELPEMCYDCHDNISKQMTEEYVHPPAEDDCRNCHSVHGSPFDDLFSENKVEICVTCHEGLQELMNKNPYTHKVVLEKEACMNCHSPHASAHEKLLVDDPDELCLGCHNKTISTPSKKIDNISRLLTNSKMVHGAIEFDGCKGCHVPHSSAYPSLLSAAFPEGPYADATPDTYGLCFICHEDNMIREKETTSATNFRNADQNLHFLHIAGDKGRSCSLCHDMHGSMNDHLISFKVSFGNWQMPIVFTNNVNGGSCSTGCHSAKKYDRVNFIDNSVVDSSVSFSKISKYVEPNLDNKNDEIGEAKLIASTKQIEFKELRTAFKSVVLPTIQFLKHQSNIVPGTEKDLLNVINFMKDHPESRILIKGFTDGANEKNFDITLSIYRAEKVKRMIVGFGINTDRIETKGCGSADPVASNKTRQGRKMNRRVEFELIL